MTKLQKLNNYLAAVEVGAGRIEGDVLVIPANPEAADNSAPELRIKWSGAYIVDGYGPPSPPLRTVAEVYHWIMEQ